MTRPSIPYMIGKYAILTIGNLIQAAIVVGMLWAYSLMIMWLDPWRHVSLVEYARREYNSTGVLIAFGVVMAVMAVVGWFTSRRKPEREMPSQPEGAD